MRLGAFIGMLALCVLVRAWLIAHTDAISPDGPEYLNMAREWSESPAAVVRNYDYHVGYPVAIDGAHWALEKMGGVSGPMGWVFAGQIVSLLAAVAAMAALWTLAEIGFDWRVALPTTVILAVSYKWAILGADVMSDALAVAFELWAAVFALWALQRLQDRSGRAVGLAAITGLCAGLGYLVRPESLVMLVLACGLWIVFQLKARLDWRPTAAAVLAATIATAACAAPYMIAIGAITKKKRVSDIVQLPAGFHFPLAIVNFQTQRFSPFRAVLSDLGGAMHWVLFGLAVVWLVTWIVTRAGPNWPATGFLPIPKPGSAVLMLGAAGLLTPLLMGLYAHVGYLDYRHAMLLGLLLAPLGGAGWVFIADTLEILLFRRRLLLGAAIKLICMVVVCTLIIVNTLAPLHEGKRGEWLAGQRIAQELTPRDFILTDSAHFLRYSGGVGFCINGDQTSGSQVLDRIRNGKPHIRVVALTRGFLVANPALAAQLRPPVFIDLLGGQTDSQSISVFRVNRDAAAEVLR